LQDTYNIQNAGKQLTQHIRSINHSRQNLVHVPTCPPSTAIINHNHLQNFPVI